MPTAESSTPSGSEPGVAPASRVSGTVRTMPTMTSSPTGMLSQNAQRHDTSVASQPPISGPIAAMPPIAEPQTANAMVRARPVKVALSVDRVLGTIMAAPMPCTSRAVISMVPLVLEPATTEEAMNTTMPVAKTLRRPCRSPKRPTVSSRAANIRA